MNSPTQFLFVEGEFPGGQRTAPTIRHARLFRVLPDEMEDPAFLDRIQERAPPVPRMFIANPPPPSSLMGIETADVPSGVSEESTVGGDGHSPHLPIRQCAIGFGLFKSFLPN